jgi:hypothetical protein
MLTCDESASRGPIVQAVCAHAPGQAVLAEADALDRALRVAPRSWETLLCGIEAFVGHYPSLLLHAPAALRTLGDACREGARVAKETDVRTRAAALLIRMQNAISAAIIREGVARIDPEIPRLMGVWLSDLSVSDVLALVQPEQVLPALLSFGKSILMVADDGKPPQQWFALVYATDRLLQRPIPGGAPHGPPGAEPIHNESTRVVQLRKDQERLKMLESALENNERTAADVFLELSAVAKRRGLPTPSPTGG